MRRAVEAEQFRQRAVGCLDGLHRFAFSLCHDRTLAQDLVQETFVRALAAKRRPEANDGVRPWLFTILHNVWRNERRRPQAVSLEEHAGALLEEVGDPGEAVDRRSRAQRIRAAVHALPEPFREVVLLRFGEGFSYRQIAEILACPAGTVMSRLARARVMLRRCVGARQGVSA